MCDDGMSGEIHIRFYSPDDLERVLDEWSALQIAVTNSATQVVRLQPQRRRSLEVRMSIFAKQSEGERPMPALSRQKLRGYRVSH